MTTSFPAAPWSTTLKVVSALTTVLIVGIAIALPLISRAPAAWLLAIGLLLLAITPLPFVVIRYDIQDHTLRIRRLLWHTVINLHELQSVDADPKLISGSLRIFGNGGMFSFTGWYSNKRLGRYRAFVTDWQHATLLEWPTRKIVLSPANPASFMQALAPLHP